MLKKISYIKAGLNNASLCLTLMTRIRLPSSFFASSPSKTDSTLTWYWLPALVVAGVQSTTALLLTWFSFDYRLCAIIIFAVPQLMTKGFHFDGLCDCADAFLCDTKPEQRREIMKDSRIGSFALLSGIIHSALVLLFLWIIFEHHDINQTTAGIFLASFLGRASIPVLAWKSVYPRKRGLGQNIVGHNNSLAFASHSAICILICFIVVSSLPGSLWYDGCIAIIIIAFGLLAWRRIAHRLIEGITGDVLGAWVELANLLILGFFAFRSFQ